MKFTWTLCGLLLIAILVSSNPIIKREAENEIDPLNEVYVFDVNEDQSVDDERTDRDKRKIGFVKLGISNGIINFVFGKLDAFLDAKTKALEVLDESNKAKNAIYGIDNTQSATGQFLSRLISQKIQAGTSSIGPLINTASTFVNSAGSGLTNAFVSKLMPLSSLISGISATGPTGNVETSPGGGSIGGSSGAVGSQLFSTLLSSKLGLITSLSGSSSSDSNENSNSSNGNGNSASAGASAGINLGAFTNLGGKTETTTTTEENIPIFDRQKVSLEIPSPIFGSGFNLITKISMILNNVILNSARRTQTLLEIFKPFFRGIFAIKGLPLDNPQ